jgi:hypothetical protein
MWLLPHVGGNPGTRSNPVYCSIAPRRQGLRMKNSGEDLQHVGIVPTGAFAAASEAIL